MTLLVRTQKEPLSMKGLVEDTVRAIDPDVPLFDGGPLTDQIAKSMRRELHFARLTSVCGTLALVLACMGIYGTVAYSVGRRTREIGIRMALGARSTQIMHSVMGEMRLVGLGIVLGLLGSWPLSRWMESQLYELSASDPLSLALATLVLATIAALAIYLPARRASRVDPAEVLRLH
jgi:ABC-type lipoprotein release transport system permease subunit